MAAHLGEHLTGAFKEIVRAELQDVISRQQQHEGRLEQLEKSVRFLSEQHAQDSQNTRAELQQQSSELGKLRDQLQAEYESRIGSVEAEIKRRLDRHESGEDGQWGLLQLRERVEAATSAMGQHQKVVAETRSRTDDFHGQLRGLHKQCEQAISHCKSSAERLREVEEGHSAVGERQQIIEDSVAKKYDSLWQDVTKALESVKSTHSGQQTSSADRSREEKRTAGRNSINYVTQMVATIHDEKKRLAVSKDLLNHWREQTWAAQRKRTGLHWLCGALRDASRRRQRAAVSRWSHATSIEVLEKRLRDEYEAKIPDVRAEVENMGLPARCSKLDQDLESLRQESSQIKLEKCSNEDLKKAQAETRQIMSQQASGLTEITKTLTAFDATLKSQRAEANGTAQKASELERKLGSCESDLLGKLAEHEQAMATRAASNEVKDLLRDVCQLWSSIKQLDAAKADRKDVDLLGIEKMVAAGEEKASKAAVDDLSGELRSKCAALDQKVEDHSRQSQHWETMWEQLTTNVEELVSKVATLHAEQSVDVTAVPADIKPSSMPPVPAASGSYRPESRGRPHSASRSRAADIPTLATRSSSVDRPTARIPKAMSPDPRSASEAHLDPVLSTARIEGSRGALPPWQRFRAEPRQPQPIFARGPRSGSAKP